MSANQDNSPPLQGAQEGQNDPRPPVPATPPVPPPPPPPSPEEKTGRNPATLPTTAQPSSSQYSGLQEGSLGNSGVAEHLSALAGAPLTPTTPLYQDLLKTVTLSHQRFEAQLGRKLAESRKMATNSNEQKRGRYHPYGTPVDLKNLAPARIVPSPSTTVQPPAITAAPVTATMEEETTLFRLPRRNFQPQIANTVTDEMDVVREEEIDVVGGGPEVPSTVEEYMEWVPVASGTDADEEDQPRRLVCHDSDWSLEELLLNRFSRVGAQTVELTKALQEVQQFKKDRDDAVARETALQARLANSEERSRLLKQEVEDLKRRLSICMANFNRALEERIQLYAQDQHKMVMENYQMQAVPYGFVPHQNMRVQGRQFTPPQVSRRHWNGKINGQRQAPQMDTSPTDSSSSPENQPHPQLTYLLQPNVPVYQVAPQGSLRMMPPQQYLVPNGQGGFYPIQYQPQQMAPQPMPPQQRQPQRQQQPQQMAYSLEGGFVGLPSFSGQEPAQVLPGWLQAPPQQVSNLVLPAQQVQSASQEETVTPPTQAEAPQ